MTYRKPKGAGSIHGWSTTRTRQTGYYRQHDIGEGLVFGARLCYWAILAATLVAVFFVVA